MTGLARRRVLAVLAGAPVALLQQGCGFEPVHARRETGRPAPEELAAIRVGRIGSGSERRIGHILRNELIERLTAGVGPRRVRYDLEIRLRRSGSALQVQTTSETTRYNLVLRADIVLRDAETRESLYRETVRSTASYDVVRSRYATLEAERSAAEGAARDLSYAIAGLLALHFAEGGAP